MGITFIGLILILYLGPESSGGEKKLWTSINTDAFLAVTAHFVDENTTLKSVELGVTHFPQAHTALNLVRVKKELLVQWGISNEVSCLVTDGVAMPSV